MITHNFCCAIFSYTSTCTTVFYYFLGNLSLHTQMISNVRCHAFQIYCTHCKNVSSPGIILAQKKIVPAGPPYAQINIQSVWACMPAGAQKRIYLNWVISMISTVCYYLSTGVSYPRALLHQWGFCMASTVGVKGLCLQR